MKKPVNLIQRLLVLKSYISFIKTSDNPSYVNYYYRCENTFRCSALPRTHERCFVKNMRPDSLQNSLATTWRVIFYLLGKHLNIDSTLLLRQRVKSI